MVLFAADVLNSYTVAVMAGVVAGVTKRFPTLAFVHWGKFLGIIKLDL